MSTRKTPPLRLAAVALAIGGLLPVATMAAEQMTVVRDAETGQLRAPTAAEAAALSGASRAAPAPASATTGKVGSGQRVLRHGGVALDVDASSHMYTVARRQADGTIDRTCVQGDAAAEQAMKPAPTFTKKPVLTAPRTARGEAYELQ